MRRVWFVWLAIGVIGGLWFAAPLRIRAQDTLQAAQIFILRPVVATDHGSTLGVSVPFQLRDSDGRTVDNASITEMKLRLLDMPPGAITNSMQAEAQQIETPMYVALLIDTSGSMGQVLTADGGNQTYLDAVRSAAERTVSNAPLPVRFRIVSFRGRDAQNNPLIEVQQDFTPDRTQAIAAIGRITNPDGSTCYYDTVFESLAALAQVDANNPATVRKVVIAFTDGDDRISRDDPSPCSRHTIDEVINTARTQEITVHTIGIKNNNDPTAVKDGDLRRLASATGGISAIGSAVQIDALFDEVFAGLVNQYVAEFEVLAKPGRNEAILEIRLNGRSELISSPPFEFISPKDYIPATPTPVPPTDTPPPPTATPVPGLTVFFVPNAAQPDQTRGIYRFTITVDQPQIVDQLLIQVMNENRVQIDQQVIDLDGRPTLDFDVEMARLRSNEKYIVEVQAINGAGELIPEPPRAGRDEIDLILAELEFEHYVEPAPPLAAVIRSIEPDAGRGVLLVELDINQPNLVDDYQAFINDESGQKVKDTEMRVYPGGPKVEVPMPDAAIQPVDAPEPLEFNLFIRLRTADNVDSDTEPFGFKLIPPAKPGFFAAIWIGINANPLIAIAIVVVISSIVLYFVFGRKPARPAYSLARSAEEYTVVAGAAGGGGGKQHGKLVVDVFETPSPGERKKQSFNRFPCVIGRSSQCDVRLEGDSQLSRRHAQLVLENGRILLTDLGSGNGTFVDDQRIDPNTATPLSDGQVIRLARQTRIRVNVSY